MKNKLKIILTVILTFTKSVVLPAQTMAQPFAVVELFTSEGCSSCPPADHVLSKIIDDAKKNHRNIFCLEYHVDYWNHGGWKDPFSKNQFTLRQNNYSAALKERELYTPQMIVNGEQEFTGSHEEEANSAIDKALKEPAKFLLATSIDSVAGDSVYVHYVQSGTVENTSIHFTILEDGLRSKIGKGENSGKTLIHDHVVRIFYSFEAKEKTGTARIPLKGLTLNKDCSLIVFVQHKQTMKILAAAEKDFSGFLKPTKE
jgi:hypothetical protein